MLTLELSSFFWKFPRIIIMLFATKLSIQDAVWFTLDIHKNSTLIINILYFFFIPDLTK